MTTKILAALGLLTLGALLAGADRNLPPADVLCEEAPVSSKRVPVPANARVVSAGPGAGRPWACFVVGRLP